MSKTTMPKKDMNLKLEAEYKKLFSPVKTVGIVEQKTSLSQPHMLKIVQSVVTYAAYEDPV